MEQINLNDLFLNLNNETKKIECINNYQPRITKAVYENSILKDILKSIPQIFEEDEKKDAVKNKLKDGADVLVIQKLLEISDSLELSIIYENYLIYIFIKTYWKPISEPLFKSFLSQVAITCGIPELSAKKVATIGFLYAQFMFDAAICTKDKVSKRHKINLANGTFHVRDGESNEVSELKPHNKEDYFKYQLPFCYDPEATALLFIKYLNRVLPDIDSQNILFEYLGYIFIKNMKLEKILILYGSGSNGKSVLFEIIMALLGKENVSNFSMENLCDEKGYHRVHIESKLLNYASEFGGKINIQTFKKLVSGEPIDARSPHKEPVIIDNYCKFILNANKLPEIEHSDAFFRRQLILTFKQKISEEEKDINLAKKIIKSELSGVFNLILQGLDRLILQQGFSTSSSVEHDLMMYRKETNSVSLFLDEENWQKSTNSKTKLKDLYSNYRTYCLESGQRAFAQPNFSKRLTELGFEIQHKGTNNYTYVWVEKNEVVSEINPFSQFTTQKEFVAEILNS
jgi:putative DNA primase/helicase